MDENLNLAGNTEIEKALKEFEVKNPEQAQKAPEITSAIPQKKVEGITFETDKAEKFYSETETPKVVKLVMKWSGVKEQKQAEYVLLVFIVLAIAVSLFLVFGGIGSSGAKPLTNNQIEQIIKNQQGVQTP